MRGFAAAAQPLYLLNVMRYHPTLAPVQGLNGFSGTPAGARVSLR